MGENTRTPDLAPPWVLFCDKGKPVAILPAMRPGEVAKVSHLTMHEAQEIVRLANELHRALVEAKLRAIQDGLMAIAAELTRMDALASKDPTP